MLEPAINSMKDFTIALLDAKKELETNGLGSAIKVMVDHIVGELNKMADRIPEVMRSVIDGMVSFINNSLPSLMALGGKIVQNIATGIVGNKDTIATGISSLISQIASWINNNMPAIMEAGKAILDAIKTGIENNLPAIETAVYNITRTAVDLFLQYKGMILEAGLQVGGEFIKGVWEGVWNAGRNYKPQNDNYWTPPPEDARAKGQEYGTVWVTSSGEVLKKSPSFWKAITSKDTYTEVALDGQNTGYAYVNGVQVKISEQSPEVKKAVEQLLKSEEKAKEEGKKSGQATAQGAKEGVQQGKEQVKQATKQVATESSKAMLDELKNLTPETYQKMLDVSQKVRQEASNLYNGAKTSFVNLANVAKNQFSNIYSSCSRYMDNLRRDVLNDWNAIRSGLSKGITGKISVTRTTSNVAKTVSSRMAPEVALSGQYYNARTRNSRAVNNVLAPAKAQVVKNDTQVVKELQHIYKLLEVLLSERTTVIDNTISIDGRAIAKASARYIEEEINISKIRSSRLAGSFSF